MDSPLRADVTHGFSYEVDASPVCTHQVRNTEYVIGLVVNTGKDSKVMQGQQDPPLKTSSIDRGINYLMLGVMTLQILMCLACTVLDCGKAGHSASGRRQRLGHRRSSRNSSSTNSVISQTQAAPTFGHTAPT